MSRSQHVTTGEQVRPQPRRFYDGGVLPVGDRIGLPPDPAHDPRIVLERHLEDGLEVFSLERRIAYDDRHLGEILVPATTDFRTDLTSTPALFTWLVPKTGAHLPAALVHDALVAGGGEPSYDSTEGHTIDRVEADRVFRDAMADTGTGVVRRWIVWTAVTAATIFVPGGLPRSPGGRPRVRWAHRIGAGASIAVILSSATGPPPTWSTGAGRSRGRCRGWARGRGGSSSSAGCPARSSSRWCWACCGAASGWPARSPG